FQAEDGIRDRNVTGVQTCALPISVTTPTNRRMLPKLDPLTGNMRMVESVTWVSRHVLAYFDSRTGSFTGPFDLADAPSLAHVNRSEERRVGKEWRYRR